MSSMKPMAILWIATTVTVGAVLIPIPGGADTPTSNGTQPPLYFQLNPPGLCASCHGDYDNGHNVRPVTTWKGSMMANAGRDPLFWAALDVANNDLPGIGEWCLRCHSPGGWLEGRGGPPIGSADGCGLNGQIDGENNDFEGLHCEFCHRMQINPSPPAGQQSVYYENGQYWIDDRAACNGIRTLSQGPVRLRDAPGAPTAPVGELPVPPRFRQLRQLPQRHQSDPDAD